MTEAHAIALYQGSLAMINWRDLSEAACRLLADFVAKVVLRPVVEFFYSDPSAEFVQIVHDHSALASWQVGSADEARKAAAVGCDMIVAQGSEAGGHVRGTVGLVHLLCEVLEAAPEVPVLAAGGIGTGRAMAAALAASAAGVRVGTRFLAAAEADVHPIYVDALIAAGAEDSIYTRTFHVGSASRVALRHRSSRSAPGRRRRKRD